MDPRRTSRAPSRRHGEQHATRTTANSNVVRNTNNNNNIASATTTRRTRSRSGTPAPAPPAQRASAQRAPALSTSTPAQQPALATISEGAAQPDEAGPSTTTNNPTVNTNTTTANTNTTTANPNTTNATTNNTTATTSTTIRKSRARPANPLDAPPSFATRQQGANTTITSTTTNINTNTAAAAQLPQTTAFPQTTGPALSLFSQPPPPFSQPSGTFGAGAFGGGRAAPFNTSFGATPLNTSFGGAAFTTARGGTGRGGMGATGRGGGGGATGGLEGAADLSMASFISTLSSPTPSGNFRNAEDTSVVSPNPRTNTNTRTLLNMTTPLPNTTALNAPRDTRPQIISDDEEEPDDEFSKELRASTSRTHTSGPGLHQDTHNYLFHSTRPTRAAAIGSEEEGGDAHFNELYGSFSRSRSRKAISRSADRPAPIPFDKELEFFTEMHAGGEEPVPAGSRGAVGGAVSGGNAGIGGTAGNAGTPGNASGGGSGGAGRRRHTAIPARGGRSQKLTRSGPTVAHIMGAVAVETSVSYGAAAAGGERTGEGSRGPGRHGGDGSRGPGGPAAAAAGTRGHAGPTGGHAGAAGGHAGPIGAADTSRERDTGGVGDHRNSRRRASPVGMSSHPYSFSGLTPSSTNATSSGNTPANLNTNINAAAKIKNPTTNPNPNPAATAINQPDQSTNVTGNAPGLGLANASTSLQERGDASAGAASQVWHAGFGLLAPTADIDNDNDDEETPSRENRSPERSRAHNPAAGPSHTPGNSGGGGAEDDPVVDEPTDDEEKAKRMADERRKAKWQREADARKAQRRSAKGLGPTTPIPLGRNGYDDDNDRTPTQASQRNSAFSVASAPVASTSQGAPGVGGVVPKVSGRPGLWKSAAEPSGAEDVIEEPANRPSHTRTNTVASGSNQTAISRLGSAVSQLPALPGIPGSFDGLSGIGGQNELGVSQFEESLPALRYNSRRTGPALSTIHDERDDNAAVGVSFNPYVDLESQTPTRPHSDIIYNSSGNPVARSSGEALRSESSEILPPVFQPLPDEVYIPAAQPPPVASGSRTSQSTSSSQGRRKIRFGSYDPADDLVSWDNPPDPNRAPGDTTGPQLFTREQEELNRRVKTILGADDHEGNLAYGRSRQTILDSVVRPVSEIRAASTSASPTRNVPAAAAPAPVVTTAGPSIGDDPSNPLIIDDPPSPTPSEIRTAGRHYLRTVVIPDRDRRLRGVHSDDEEMQRVGPPAPLPTYQLPAEGSELGEDEVPVAAVEDDAQLESEGEPQRNSSGSGVADDNDAEDLDPANTQEKPIIGEWHEDQLDEVSLEDKMEGLFPARSFISEPPLDTTPLGQALARQSSSTQPSMSSVGDMPDNPPVSFSALYPPNQQAYMKMHAAADVNDAETEPSFHPSQPARAFDTNLTPFSDGDLLGEPADNNPPSGRLSSYPHPDNLSISTDNSVLRSQLFSSKLLAYNADQAALKPGDEGYAEPQEENYVKWARAEEFSDAASTETAPSVAPVKGEKPFKNPFLGLLVRMPGASETNLSGEETSRPSGDSLAIVPDSQGEPPLLSQPAAPSTSTKTKDPRRRPEPPMIDNGIHAYSEAGPSGSQTSETRASPQPVKNRTAWQLSSAKPYVGSPVLSAGSATSPEFFSVGAGRSATDPLPLIGTSQARSEAEAQIEAELVPETQFSQPISHASSTSSGRHSPVIHYEEHLKGLSKEPRHSSRRIPVVLVPGTASPSQESNIISREPSAVAAQLGLDAEGDTEEERLIEQSADPQEDSFGISGIGVQNEWVAETQHEHIETQNEPTDASVPGTTIPSFELPGPAAPNAESQQPITAKRKRGEVPTEPVENPTETVEDPADKPSPGKKARKVPAPPTPLPVEPAEPMRRTRSFTSKPPASRGPLKTPVPPARLTDAGRSRKPKAVPRTPPRQPQRKMGLSSIIETSSPLSPLPPSSPSAREETFSPIRRSKTYLKGRTLVPNSSTSQVDEDEVLGTSGEQAETHDSGTQATQDPFKSLAKSMSKSKLGKRKASVAPVDPVSATKSIAPAKPSTRKRTREDTPEDDLLSIGTDLSPPPSKKHRREVSVSKPKKSSAKAAPSKQPKPGALFVSSPRRSCQRGGRVFARWKKLYYTATVKDSWEDENDEDEIRCQVQFDDKTWAELPLSELYRCELQEGDKVLVPGAKGKAPSREVYVSAVPLWEERCRVSVRLASIPQEEVAIFDGKKIAVNATYVKKEWQERKATCLEDIGLGDELIRVQQEKERKEAEAKAIGRTIPSAAFLGPPRWKDSPPPPPRLSSLPSRGRKRPPQATDIGPRLEPPSTTEASSSKPLAGHIIIHALAVNDDKGNPLAKAQRTAQKQELTANIERLGGKVVDGFGELLGWGGKVSEDVDRWVWKAGAIKYVEQEPSAPIGTSKRRKHTPGSNTPEPPKIFLVADGPNRATKYLMALAAGIPCVDQGWIRDENAAPWHTYLLPAGQSPSLGHVCSQWVDHSYSQNSRTLKTLLEEPGSIHKAFNDKTILFLNPSKSGSEIDEDQVAHTYPYAALACLMGASRVEVVHDIHAASRELEQYDAIVHEDENFPAPLLKFSKTKKGRGVICTDINWVRDCLITGTFLRRSKSQ